MNILFISEHAVHFGGIGAVVGELRRRLQQAGHRCFLYINAPIPAALGELSFDGAINGPLASPARLTDFRQQNLNQQACRYFKEAILQWQIDLVHCHEIHRSLYTAGLCCSCPILASSHGGVFHKRYEKKRVIRAYRRFSHKVSYVTVLNEAMAATMRQRFGNMFKLVTIPNGIEDSWLQSEPARPRDILLGAGRLSTDKRYDLAIDAYAASTSRHSLPLVIAGEGETGEQIAARARKHDIDVVKDMPRQATANTLYLPGYQTGNNKKQLFSRARLFLHPSQFEAFGIVLLEAMAQGALPLCADLATYRSQFPAQDFQLVYVPELAAGQWAAAIDQWSGYGELATLTSANREATRQFAWSAIFEKYFQCYSNAVTSHDENAHN